MLVPRYWAEAKLTERHDKRQVTVRRFGWSLEGQADAQRLAEQRARDAMARVRAGEPLPRREPTVPYNGADGVPVREEIVSEHQGVVITRNSYGARCLNVADVLIADVDFKPEVGARFAQALLFGTPLLALGLCLATRSLAAALGGALGALGLAWLARHLLLRGRALAAGGDEGLARRRVAAFARRHPEWRLHSYRTPVGLRVFATHRRFDPREPAVEELFAALDVDPRYRAMCRLQRCFRARLTAKPWRIGLSTHLKPRPGVWPVREERRAERAAWLREYDARALGYAACRYLESHGGGQGDVEAERVRALHDEHSGAQGSLPLA